MEWQKSQDIVLPNKSLKNTLQKSKNYRIDSRKHCVNLVQNLSETTICLDIPCYLLELWCSHFRDSSNSLIKIFTIIKAQKVSKENFNNTEYIVTSSGALINRLNEYGDFFEKYLKSTKSFANRNEKFKISVLKSHEELRFIPTNLHLEQFDVESQFDGDLKKRSVYDFTTVGAFTTVHMNKNAVNQNSVELLMRSENSAVQSPYEVTLVFYSLKIFIYILNDLLLINKTEDKIKVSFPILRCSKNLAIISRSIIPGFELVKLEKIDPTRSNLTRASLVEKFKYLAIKFEELNGKVKQTEFQNLDDFMFKITEPIIELYNIVFTEGISEKIEFLNNCAIFSHSLTTLIASLDMKYINNSKVSDTQLENLFKFHLKNGVLFQVESMLSCSSTEADMMFDHYKAIQSLNHVQLHFPKEYLGFKNSSESIFIVVRSDGYHVYFYSNVEVASKGIKIHPVLFNVGINEQAFSSNFLGNNLLQKYINSNSIIKLRKYYNLVRDDLKDMELKKKIDILMKRMETNKAFIDNSRPVELLHIVSEIVRMIGGFRVTNCKSGKDRTGVSVSLEQYFILVRDHNFDNSLSQYILDDLRRNGTRLDVVHKNIGKKIYAFNKIRYFLLPQLYQPPIDLCGDYET